MSEKQLPDNETSVIPLDKRKFVEIMSNPEERSAEEHQQLVNEQKTPLDKFIHPLSHSIDPKKHPDMVAIPVCYRTSRNLLKKYKKLTQEYK